MHFTAPAIILASLMSPALAAPNQSPAAPAIRFAEAAPGSTPGVCGSPYCDKEAIPGHSVCGVCDPTNPQVCHVVFNSYALADSKLQICTIGGDVKVCGAGGKNAPNPVAVSCTLQCLTLLWYGADFLHPDLLERRMCLKLFTHPWRLLLI